MAMFPSSESEGSVGEEDRDDLMTQGGRSREKNAHLAEVGENDDAETQVRLRYFCLHIIFMNTAYLFRSQNANFLKLLLEVSILQTLIQTTTDPQRQRIQV